MANLKEIHIHTHKKKEIKQNVLKAKVEKTMLKVQVEMNKETWSRILLLSVIWLARSWLESFDDRHINTSAETTMQKRHIHVIVKEGKKYGKK